MNAVADIGEAAELTAAWEPLATAVILLDSASGFRCANPAFCEMFEVGQSRLRGLALQEFGQPGKTLLPLVQRVLAGGRAIAARAGACIRSADA